MAVEYALLIALVTLICLTSVRSLATSIRGPLASVAARLGLSSTIATGSERAAHGRSGRNYGVHHSSRNIRGRSHDCHFGRAGDDSDVHAWLDALTGDAKQTAHP